MARFKKMVGVAGFEPAAHWSQTSCATKLRYTPILYGGEDGIRTHAALANPNDLANRPLQPLEYFSRYSFVLFRHVQDYGGEGGIRTHGPFRSHWFSRPAP